MTIPRQVIIAGHTIKVRYKKGLSLSGVDCWGIYDDIKHTIYLAYGMDKSRKSEIFLHECIHAIEHIHAINLGEKTVKILGIEILGLIRNNRIRI